MFITTYMTITLGVIFLWDFYFRRYLIFHIFQTANEKKRGHFTFFSYAFIWRDTEIFIYIKLFSTTYRIITLRIIFLCDFYFRRNFIFSNFQIANEKNEVISSFFHVWLSFEEIQKTLFTQNFITTYMLKH